MALQILNKLTPGAMAGQSFGAGLQQGIQALLQDKLGEMQTQRKYQSQVNLLNRKAEIDQAKINEQKEGLVNLLREKNLPEGIASLSPSLQPTFIKHLLQEPQDAAYNQLITQITGMGSASPVSPDALTSPDAPRLSAKQVTDLTKISQRQRQLLESKGKARWGATIDRKTAKSEIGEYNIPILSQLKELNKSFKPGLGVFDSEQTQLFKSLLNQIIPTDKSKADIKRFQANVDEILKQSPAVRAKTIDDLLSRSQADFQEGQAISDIIQEVGYIPEDFDKRLANLLKTPRQDIGTQTLEDSIQEEVSPETSVMPASESAENPQSMLEYLVTPRKNIDQNQYIASKLIEGLVGGVTALPAIPGSLYAYATGQQPDRVTRALQDAPSSAQQAISNYQPSEAESAVGETIENFASLVAPGAALKGTGSALSKIGKSAEWINKAAKILGITPKMAASSSIIGNAAKVLTKNIGGSEGEANAAKVGTQILAGLLTPQLASRSVTQMGKQLEQQIPEAAVIATKGPFRTAIDKLYNTLGKSEIAGAKPLRDALVKIDGPTANVKELLALRSQLAEAAASPSLNTLLKDTIPQATKVINNGLLNYARKAPGEIGKIIPKYLDLGNAVNQQSVVLGFAKKHIGKLTGSMYGMSRLGRMLGLRDTKSTAILGTALAGGQIEKILKMATASPEFANNYLGLTKAALGNSVTSFNKYAKKIEDDLKELD